MVAVTKAPHCIGCHSEDHYGFDCIWKKVLRLGRLPNEHKWYRMVIKQNLNIFNNYQRCDHKNITSSRQN